VEDKRKMDLLREKYGSVRVAKDGLMEEMNFAAIAFVGSVRVTNCYFEPEVRLWEVPLDRYRETLDPYRDCPGATSRGVSKDYLPGQFR
jgi:hypothetical protein